MKFPLVALSLVPAALLLGGCGDEPAPDTTTPAATETEQSETAWLEDFKTTASGEAPLDALTIFEELKANQAELLTSDNLLTMATYAVEVGKSIELTQPILDYAVATFPAEIGKFGGIDAAIFRLKNPAAANVPLDGAHAPIGGAAAPEDDGANQ